ncbi:MAG: hypothetical protein ACK559_10565, partial [bacterium]
FSGRHRYSVEQSDGTKLDHTMVDALIKLYPDHDGYICKSMWPSYHQGGFLLPELCLFKPAICVTTLEKKGGGTRRKDVSKEVNCRLSIIILEFCNLCDKELCACTYEVC